LSTENELAVGHRAFLVRAYEIKFILQYEQFSNLQEELNVQNE